MARVRTPFNLDAFLSKTHTGKAILSAPKKQILFSQGDATEVVFYVQAGKVKVTVVDTGQGSRRGDS